MLENKGKWISEVLWAQEKNNFFVCNEIHGVYREYFLKKSSHLCIQVLSLNKSYFTPSPGRADSRAVACCDRTEPMSVSSPEEQPPPSTTITHGPLLSTDSFFFQQNRKGLSAPDPRLCAVAIRSCLLLNVTRPNMLFQNLVILIFNGCIMMQL